MSLASLARLLAAPGASTPGLQADMAQALVALPAAEILARVEAQPPGNYAGWPIASWPQGQLSVFALGPHTAIPLHDHPDMRIFTRLLSGAVDCTAYDWIDVERLEVGNLKSVTLSPGSAVWVTQPQESNVHTLNTAEGCVFLDLFCPYYDATAGRVCTYYDVASSDEHSTFLRPQQN